MQGLAAFDFATFFFSLKDGGVKRESLFIWAPLAVARNCPSAHHLCIKYMVLSSVEESEHIKEFKIKTTEKIGIR